MKKPAVFLLLFLITFITATSAQNTFPASTAQINYMGRVGYVANQSVSLSWTGCSAIIKFKGTTISTAVSGINHKLAFYVDGVKQNQLASITANNQILKIADNLTNTEHEVIIKRVSLVNTTLLLLHSVITDGVLLDITPNPLIKKIEFFGNSVSEGFAAGAQNASQADNYLVYSDHSSAYTCLVADSLNAEYHNTSISGIAVCQGAGPFTAGMETKYNKLYPLDSVTTWNFKKFIPDLCVMALGVNDNNMPAGISWTTWQSKYKQLVLSLRNQYGPNTSFLFAVAPMVSPQSPPVISIKMIVSDLKAMGVNASFYVYSFTTSKHPIALEQREMASELYNYIKNNNILATAIDQPKKDDSFLIYNKSFKSLQLKKTDIPYKQVSIYSSQGYLIKQSGLANNQIDISGLSTGVYLVKLSCSENNYTQKIIID